MTQDEITIRAVNTAFAKAWSNGAAAPLGELFTDDAIRVGAMGDVAHGRDEIVAAYAKLLGGAFKGAAVKMGPQTVRFVTPEVALQSGPFEILPGDGKTPLKGFGLDVLVKRGGAWKILETHPKLFPPPPPSPR